MRDLVEPGPIPAGKLPPAARDSQTRVLDLRSGTPTFTKPAQARGGQSNENIKDGQKSEDNAFGYLGVPGRPGDGLVGSLAGAAGVPEQQPTSPPDDTAANDGDMFCADVVSLPDGRVMAVGGTDWYNEPAVMDRNNGDPADLGVSELEGLPNANLFDAPRGPQRGGGGAPAHEGPLRLHDPADLRRHARPALPLPGCPASPGPRPAWPTARSSPSARPRRPRSSRSSSSSPAHHRLRAAHPGAALLLRRERHTGGRGPAHRRGRSVGVAVPPTGAGASSATDATADAYQVLSTRPASATGPVPPLSLPALPVAAAGLGATALFTGRRWLRRTS